jgi:hypothetical protein
LDLSAKAESSFTNNKKLEQIQNQVAELMAMKKLSVKNQDSEQLKSRAAVKLNDIKELQKKLSELEKRTSNITNPYPSSGKENEEKESKRFLNRRNSSAITTAVVYTPLLVKHDDQYRKYFKLKDMSMPIDQIKAKMKTDGVDPNILDTPTAVSPNDLGPPEGAYIPMTIAEDPKFKKYFKLQQMNMPDNQIRMKMEVDGVDPSLLDHPEKVSPNDPGVSTVYVDSSPRSFSLTELIHSL